MDKKKMILSIIAVLFILVVFSTLGISDSIVFMADLINWIVIAVINIVEFFVQIMAKLIEFVLGIAN